VPKPSTTGGISRSTGGSRTQGYQEYQEVADVESAGVFVADLGVDAIQIATNSVGVRILRYCWKAAGKLFPNTRTPKHVV
jgi:hypothetical protein